MQMPCKNSSLGWNFKEDTYKGMDQFVLQLEYTYTDDSYVHQCHLEKRDTANPMLSNSVGQAPYNVVTEFSNANITDTNIDCTEKTMSCQQCTNSTITAIVYASIA